jgi:ABC-type branched-subunit amino acid transport system substrate-binding protein
MMRGIVVVAAIACLAGCKEAAPPPQPLVIRIGQDIDRTGSIATPSWSDSIRLAVGSANAGLKQAGRALRFELVEGNSGNAPETARATALALVRKQGALALITDSSQDDIAVNMLAYVPDAAARLAVPIVCMACTSPSIGDPAAVDADPVRQSALRNELHWNFRTTMSDAYQARMLIRFLLSQGKDGDVNRDGHFKLSIYASDDPDGHGFSNELRALAQQRRPDALVEQVFHPVSADLATYDWSSDVKKLVDRRNETTGKTDGAPDAVLEITFPKFAIGFTRAWVESGAKVRLVHTHNFRVARVLEQLQNQVEGQEGSSQAVLGEGPSAEIFARDLRGATGQAPAFRDAPAYDAAVSLMLGAVTALREINGQPAPALTGERWRDALREINAPGGTPVFAGIEGFAEAVKLIGAGTKINYQGASGPCDFDANGNVVAQLARFRVQQKQFVDVERYDCLRSPDCPSADATARTAR